MDQRLARDEMRPVFLLENADILQFENRNITLFSSGQRAADEQEHERTREGLQLRLLLIAHSKSS